MTHDKWLDILDMVKEKFEIIEHKTEPLLVKTGLETNQEAGSVETLIFLSPIGKTKLDYIVRPVVLEKKEHYSKRMGTSSVTEYIYSDDEFSRRLEAYLWKDERWEKIKYPQSDDD